MRPVSLLAKVERSLRPFQAAQKAFETLNGAELQGGKMRLSYEWDVPAIPLPEGRSVAALPLLLASASLTC
jgi:hypothetical protein